jgi:hypothetical protein
MPASAIAFCRRTWFAGGVLLGGDREGIVRSRSAELARSLPRRGPRDQADFFANS